MYELDSDTKGVLCELDVQRAFINAGFNVSVPVKKSSRYDMIVDAYDHLFKVQCKHAHVSEDGNSFTLSLYSTNKLQGKYYMHKYSESDVDLFATSLNGDVYVIPREVVGDKATATFRLEPPRNNQIVGINNASDYKLNTVINQFMLDYNDNV